MWGVLDSSVSGLRRLSNGFVSVLKGIFLDFLGWVGLAFSAGRMGRADFAGEGIFVGIAWVRFSLGWPPRRSGNAA